MSISSFLIGFIVGIMVVVRPGIILSPCSGNAQAFELNKGVALRQNALLMKQPSVMKIVCPDNAFGISETRTRLWMRAYIGTVRMNTACEIRSSFTSLDTGSLDVTQNSGSLLGQSQPLEYWDMTREHITGKSTKLSTRIDRLELTWSMGMIDFNIGRQPLSLGTSHFVGVLDVIAPFAPGDLDATYKPGVDAVRVYRGIGMTGEAEIIAVGARKFGDSALLGRFRSSVQGIDIECVGGRFRRRAFGGIGWEGGVGSLGIWGEMALFERRKDEEIWRGGWSKAAFSGVAGVDVSVLENTIIVGSLMFQDFGVRCPEELMTVYLDSPYREGWIFLGSASYFVVTLHRQLHSLLNGDIAGIINLIDSSTLWQPMLTISTGDNTDLRLYGWIGTGDEPEVKGFSVTTRSEFGMLPYGIGFYARWFF